ncbi:ABC1 kinase family protein [Pyxidicoccus sp. MSG2]|uniref:ABC1 kinase family protein n=1 Tax=Pyxidicoccus sp. MSG2 TaxID=2996790 RepID=UPI00226E2F81|nr:AarF/UbiB family protein [Pyxidicoccus sp. MSG2]MCY1021094.1 AarF/UbiB family protein [Pyxidicoccus sp. MSG2]
MTLFECATRPGRRCGFWLVAARAWRTAHIFWVVTGALAWLAVRTTARLGIARGTAAELGARLARTLERLGPLFIKVGQLLCARPDVIGPEVALALRRLRHRLRAVPTGRVIAAVERSLGRAQGEIFLQFDATPVATGSIAQVHRAVLKDGSIVAVKVRRPGLAEYLAADFRILRLAAWLAARCPGMTALPWRELMDELEGALAAQVDLRREADSNLTFAKNLPSIRVPRLVPELCTSDVLTMEFLPGLVPLEELELSPSERSAAVKAGLRMLYQMIFKDGFVHADLHGGNVFFSASGETTLIDFGLVARLPPDARQRFRSFFFAMATGDARQCAGLILESATQVPGTLDLARYEREVEAMMQRFSGLAVGEFEVSRFAAGLFDLQRRFQIRGSTEFTLAILSLLAFEGVAKVLDPRLPFQKEAVEYLLQLPAQPLDASARAALFAELERLVESGRAA